MRSTAVASAALVTFAVVNGLATGLAAPSSAAATSATLPSATLESDLKKNPCQPQAGGLASLTVSGVATAVPTVASVAAWQSFAPFAAVASAAAAPSGYSSVFVDSDAAIEGGSLLSTQGLDSYDVDSCASLCNSNSKCVAFNIYFQRNPAFAGICSSNQQNEIITNVYCKLFGAFSNSGSTTELRNAPYLPYLATNTGGGGESLVSFQEAITGSNLYQSSSYFPLAPSSPFPNTYFCTGTDFLGTCYPYFWSSFVCNNVGTEYRDNVGSVGPTADAHCYFYRDALCADPITQVALVYPGLETVSWGSEVGSFICI